MRVVERGDPVADHRVPLAVHRHAAAVPIAKQDPADRRVRQLGHALGVLRARFPGDGEGEQRRMHRRGLELKAESVVQVGELVGVVRLHGAGPRAHGLVHPAEHPRRGVEGQEPAQRRQGDAGAQ